LARAPRTHNRGKDSLFNEGCEKTGYFHIKNEIRPFSYNITPCIKITSKAEI
jgi:hypothetical protein